MHSTSTPASSGSRERRSNSPQLSLKSNSNGGKASEQGSQGVEAPSRNITQIKRLTYLLDAQEAKVQAVLDEAMSWLIVPFSSIPDDVTAPAPGSTVSPGSTISGNECSDSSRPEADVKVKRDDVGLVATAKSVSVKSVSLAANVCNTTHDVSSGQSQLDAVCVKLPRDEEVAKASKGPEIQHTGTGDVSEEELQTKDCSLEMKGRLDGTAIDSVDHSVRKYTHHAHVESAEEAVAVPTAEEESSPVLSKKAGGASSDLDSSLHESFSFPFMTFTPEELEKLDAEAAWDELDADDELHANDYSFSLSLLPQLVVDSSPTPSSESGALRQTAPRRGSIISTAAAQAFARAEDASASLESPKRKRGRPKGSGRKVKGRLEKDTAAALPVAGRRGTTHEASLSVDANPPRRRQTSPGFPLYDSQSPGSSALTNSPSSLWAGCGADTFPSLTDLTDGTADTGSQSLSSLPLASPATPSSGASPVLRSFSTASSAASAGVQEDVGAAATVLSPSTSLALPAATFRSARAASGNHARRLAFCPEDDEMEDAPLSPVLGSKKSQKGRTGRPRGRPRKTHPQERACSHVEDSS